MRTRFIRSSEKKRIESELNEQFGITKLPFLLLESGKEKTRGFSGNLSKEEIAVLAHTANIEIIGTYLLKKESDFRLSFDASQILKNQIEKNIVEINEDEYQKWIRGYDLEKKVERGTIIIKFKNDFLGCGRSNGDKIFNYVPKDRRLKTQLKNL